MSVKKRAVQIAVFLLIMFLTFYALFSGRDLAEIGRSIARMSPVYLIPSAALAVFFVCAEGFMIWFLLNAMREKKNSLFRCFQYSFIGFFYSGITPSASGGVLPTASSKALKAVRASPLATLAQCAATPGSSSMRVSA